VIVGMLSPLIIGTHCKVSLGEPTFFPNFSCFGSLEAQHGAVG